MKVLVVGGTGTVGGALVKTLLARSVEVAVTSRGGAAASRVPDGVTVVSGDLSKPVSLATAFKGADGVFLMAPVSESETSLGLAGVAAAKAAGVKRLVYLSVFMPPGSEVVPHFASKLPIENAVRESGMGWTILRPNNFFQNDVMARHAILEGVYPSPLGSRGLNRVDVRDIAEAAANAFEQGIDGLFPLNGPRGLTGEDTARVYTETLNRPVRYAGDDLDAWASRASTALPAWLVRDLRIMYEFFLANGMHASGRDFLAQERVLGHAPRTFERYAAELMTGATE
jgi:uncharacterized protein YbjT (DUF2867 family)